MGLSFTVLDVGQGSATLIRFPRGRKMLVDGGGFYDERFDIGRSVVAPYLWHQRIGRIDTIVLTHPHPDHLQGLLFVLENFRVHEVLTNGEGSHLPLYQKFLQIVHHRGLSIKAMNASTPAMNIDGAVVEVFNPRSRDDIPHKEADPSFSKHQAAGKRITEDVNDRSLVIKITFQDRSFLLPADITSITENRLLLSGADLKSDVLLIPHHGSVHSSSESFIRQVCPLIGVISCGRDNIHRLPHSEVLERYKRLNTRLFRTDQDGAVTVETDGKEIKLSTFERQRR